MKVLVLTNHLFGLYKFRIELLERLVSEGCEVLVSAPYDSHSGLIVKKGVSVIQNIHLDRRGTNPVRDLKLIKYYKSLLKEHKPNVVLTYTIKPNVYGGLVCGKLGIPYIVNVTGLGTSIENKGLMQIITLFLYKIGLKHARTVFFQNSYNYNFMIEKRVVKKEIAEILPGSGVNVDHYCFTPYPDDDNEIIFTTIGRIMKDKGIDELLAAAEEIRNNNPKVFFRLIGEFDEAYEERIYELNKKGIIQYLGFQEDIREYVAESHAIIHASYHEGMSNVLLEAASMGRPVIATEVPGCIDVFDPGVTGIGFKPRDSASLVIAIKTFLSLDNEKREEMGKRGRQKVEIEFNRENVINRYISAINTM